MTGTRLPVRMPLVLATLTLFATPAHAQYVDPGSSGILIQMLIGGAVGLLTILKVYWHRITGFFGRRSRQPPQQPS